MWLVMAGTRRDPPVIPDLDNPKLQPLTGNAP